MAQADTNVGPIIFTEEAPREHLLNVGRVYTFRTADRTTGETWARKTRTGSKIADVRVEQVDHIEEPTVADLDIGWAFYSGYDSREAWWQAIADVHGNVREGYVYRVTRSDVDGA